MVLSVEREVVQVSKGGAEAKEKPMSWWSGVLKGKGTGSGTWDANGKGNVAVFASI
jgi:hypothetical protein